MYTRPAEGCVSWPARRTSAAVFISVTSARFSLKLFEKEKEKLKRNARIVYGETEWKRERLRD